MIPPARKKSKPDFPDFLSGSKDDEGELASDRVLVSARSLHIPACKFMDTDEEELEEELTKDSNAPKTKKEGEEEIFPDDMVEGARTAVGSKKLKGMQGAEVQEEDEGSKRKSTETCSGEQVRFGNVFPLHSWCAGTTCRYYLPGSAGED